MDWCAEDRRTRVLLYNCSRAVPVSVEFLGLASDVPRLTACSGPSPARVVHITLGSQVESSLSRVHLDEGEFSC